MPVRRLRLIRIVFYRREAEIGKRSVSGGGGRFSLFGSSHMIL